MPPPSVVPSSSGSSLSRSSARGGAPGRVPSSREVLFALERATQSIEDFNEELARQQREIDEAARQERARTNRRQARLDHTNVATREAVDAVSRYTYALGEDGFPADFRPAREELARFSNVIGTFTARRRAIDATEEERRSLNEPERAALDDGAIRNLVGLEERFTRAGWQAPESSSQRGDRRPGVRHCLREVDRRHAGRRGRSVVGRRRAGSRRCRQNGVGRRRSDLFVVSGRPFVIVVALLLIVVGGIKFLLCRIFVLVVL